MEPIELNKSERQLLAVTIGEQIKVLSEQRPMSSLTRSVIDDLARIREKL